MICCNSLHTVLLVHQVHLLLRPAKRRLKQSWKQLQATGSAGSAPLPTQTWAAMCVKSVAMPNRLQHSL